MSMQGIGQMIGWVLAVVGFGLYVFEKIKLEKLKAKNEMLESSQGQMEKVFKGIAQEALSSQSESFLKLAQERLDKKTVEANSTFSQKVMEVQNLIDPMKTTLTKLQEDLTKTEKERNEQFGKITQQLYQVTVSSEKLKDEASSLGRALRRPEVRGSWGEIQLKRVVELAGMSAYCDFEEQVTVRDGEKSLLKPDMIIRLPNKRNIIIDAKAVLDAFLDAVEAITVEDKLKHMERHAKNLRSRVLDLSKKSYWDQFDDTPEFAVLFIPNEALLSAATEVDRSVIEDALEQKIIIATPTTLVALLKAIAFGWQQNHLTENAQNMITLVSDFYDRLSPWMKHLSKLGDTLENAVKSYNDSVSSLESRVLPSVKRIHELGFNDKQPLPEIQPIDLALRKGKSVEADKTTEFDKVIALEKESEPENTIEIKKTNESEKAVET